MKFSIAFVGCSMALMDVFILFMAVWKVAWGVFPLAFPVFLSHSPDCYRSPYVFNVFVVGGASGLISGTV